MVGKRSTSHHVPRSYLSTSLVGHHEGPKTRARLAELAAHHHPGVKEMPSIAEARYGPPGASPPLATSLQADLDA